MGRILLCVPHCRQAQGSALPSHVTEYRMGLQECGIAQDYLENAGVDSEVWDSSDSIKSAKEHLIKQIARANKFPWIICVQFHHNSVATPVSHQRGYVIHDANSKRGHRAATLCAEELSRVLPWPIHAAAHNDRCFDVVDEKTGKLIESNRMAWVTEPVPVCLLVEFGFFSDPSAAEFYASDRNIKAEAEAASKGLVRYKQELSEKTLLE
jgi:hypothetical protein